MKRLLLLTLIFGTTAPVNAGIYYYPSYQDGIEVRCKDGRSKHLVEITKSGRGMKLVFENAFVRRTLKDGPPPSNSKRYMRSPVDLLLF